MHSDISVSLYYKDDKPRPSAWPFHSTKLPTWSSYSQDSNFYPTSVVHSSYTSSKHAYTNTQSIITFRKRTILVQFEYCRTRAIQHIRPIAHEVVTPRSPHNTDSPIYPNQFQTPQKGEGRERPVSANKCPNFRIIHFLDLPECSFQSRLPDISDGSRDTRALGMVAS